ncbi:flagellar hook-basal body complex protein FliE [Roseibium limicola]|uniref:Flagellar hook-basal body complex protein FliE n=1 Tax=Roseibium limicola TaxID=2816037 RepID=A0A939J8K3_9HYPH|nr:flagellar hook-basal body complex protein FliE [Roseibium limicola]MBO0344964.1 flagellar hook-basal body complex protein FliE [Roseibium limicola]
MSTPSLASNAYQSAARLMQQQSANIGKDVAPKVDAPDFGAMVSSAVEGVVDKGQAMDAKAIGMMEGKTDVVDVVTAIAETETALETMVAVRDKVIAAYEEIMRMQI